MLPSCGLATPAPTGSVTFFNGTTSIGKGTLNASGVATATYTNLATGQSNVTAKYVGDTNYATSTSSALTQNVIASPFTMSVDHTTVTVTSGGSAAYQAVVTAPNGTFPATVVFSVSGPPTTLVATLAPSTAPASSNPAMTTVTVSAAPSAAAAREAARAVTRPRPPSRRVRARPPSRPRPPCPSRSQQAPIPLP